MADEGVVLIYGGKWHSMQEKLLAVADTADRMGNSVVAEVAAIGRRASSSLYSSAKLRMGGTYWKNWVKNPNQPRGTYWDSALGGYASKTRKVDGRGLREMGFSFEGKKVRKSKKRFQASVSNATMYSLTANLWEHDHTMYGNPEKYQWSYDQSKWYAWKKGQVRKARPFFLSGVRQKVERSKSLAVDKVEEKYRKELQNL